MLLTALAVGVSGVVGLGSTAGASEWPQLSLTPQWDLQDGQEVTVSGTDFEPNLEVTLRVCGGGGCDEPASQTVSTDASGAIAPIQFTVHRFFSVEGETIDCNNRPWTSCHLFAQTDSGTLAAASLTFAEPSFMYSPSEGILDGQEVLISGYGFDPAATAEIVQCTWEERSVCDPASTEMASTDEYGNLETSFTVRRFIRSGSGTIDCAYARRCRLTASTSAAATARSGPITVWHPRVTATPNSGLFDGAQVDVSIDLPGGLSVTLAQCATRFALTGCDGATNVVRTTDESGNLGSFTVRTTITVDGNEIDCRAGGCAIASIDPPSGPGEALLSFGPQQSSNTSLLVNPNSGLSNGQQVMVSARAFYPASGLPADRDFEIIQCAHEIVPASPNEMPCDVNTALIVRTTSSGELAETPFVVHDVITATNDGGRQIDCRVTVCDVVARADEILMFTPLAFGTRSLTVTPNEDLKNGAAVEVQGSGLHGWKNFWLVQCPPEPSSPFGCGMNTMQVSTDAGGNFSANFVVHSPLTLITQGEPVDCVTSACTISVVTSSISFTGLEASIRMSLSPPQAAPGGVSATVISPDTVSVSYGLVPESENGGAAIGRYEATCVAPGLPEVTAVDDSAPFEAITVSALSASAPYECTVRAFNVKGAGPASTPASVVWPTAPLAAPTNLTATPTGLGVVSLAYGEVPPESDGDTPITKYEAMCHATGSPRRGEDASAPFEAIFVDGLTPGVTYACSVQAVNFVGAGPKAKIQFRAPFRPVGAPTSVSAAATANREATVSYTPVPSSLDGGAPITRYEATCRAPGEADRSAEDAGAPFDAIVVGDLSRGVTYSCAVRAFNGAGAGPDSAPASVLVPDVPSAPRSVAATVTSDQTVLVSYTAPVSDGGATITKYEATCRADGQPDRSGEDASAPFDSITISGVNRSTSYDCTVRAVNLAGEGPESTRASVYVPEPPTAAPTDVVAAPIGFGRARVSYTPIATSGNGGSPVTKYQAICRAAGQSDRIAEDTSAPFEAIIVPGLTSGVSYTCTVRAVNVAGTGPESQSFAVVAV